MVKEQSYDQKIILYKGLLMFLIVSAVLFRLLNIDFPMISNGEIPYWDWILKLAGKQGIVIEGVEYGIVSFGYCLPFSILIRCGWSLTKVYKATVIVNAIFLSVVFWMSGKLLQKICNIEKASYRMETCLFLIFLFPVFYTQVVQMGPQIVLALLTLLMVEQLFKIRENEEKKYKKIVIWGSLGVFISPAFIGVVIGCILVLGLTCAKKKILDTEEGRAILYFIAILLLMEIVEYIFMTTLYKDGVLETYSGLQSLYLVITESIKKQGILGIIFTIIGKGVYLFNNTFGLAFAGIYAMVFTKNRKESLIQVTSIIAASALIVIVLISMNGLPVDNMISMVAMLVVIPAIKYLCQKDYKKTDIMKITGIALIFACICKDIWRLKEYEQSDWTAMGFTSLGREFCNNIYQLPILMVVVISMLFVSFCFLYRYYGKNLRICNTIVGSCLLLVSVVFVYGYNQYIMPCVEKEYEFSYKAIAKMLDGAERPLYSFAGNNGNMNPLRLLLYNDKTIAITHMDDILTLSEDAILLTNHTEENDVVLGEKYKKVYETDQITVWENVRYKEENLAESLLNEEIPLPEIMTRNQLNSIYGAKCMLPAGEYKVVVQTKISTKKGVKLGKIVVGDDAGTLVSDKIYRKGKPGKVQCNTLRFKNEKDMTNFRVIVNKKAFTEVEIVKVTVTRVGERSDAEEEK